MSLSYCPKLKYRAFGFSQSHLSVFDRSCLPVVGVFRELIVYSSVEDVFFLYWGHCECLGSLVGPVRVLPAVMYL